MQVDDYQEANALAEKLKTNLPINAYPTRELIKELKKQGKTIDSDRTFEIISVLYSGDAGGIMCALNTIDEEKEAFVVSITHLKIDPDHPLSGEIQAYQRNRTRGLTIQNSRAFAAELMKTRSPNILKKRKGKGFGQ
jgi:hypothetical protein